MVTRFEFRIVGLESNGIGMGERAARPMSHYQQIQFRFVGESACSHAPYSTLVICHSPFSSDGDGWSSSRYARHKDCIAKTIEQDATLTRGHEHASYPLVGHDGARPSHLWSRSEEGRVPSRPFRPFVAFNFPLHDLEV